MRASAIVTARPATANATKGTSWPTSSVRTPARADPTVMPRPVTTIIPLSADERRHSLAAASIQAGPAVQTAA
jgi:hypothetical protein